MPASGSAAQLACVISHTLPFVRLAEDILESRAIPRKMDVSATREGELSQLAVRACLVALAATLGGCSTSEVTVQNWTPATVGGSSDATDLSRPDYRRIVADNINKIFPNSASLGDLEISQPPRKRTDLWFNGFVSGLIELDPTANRMARHC